MTPECADLHSYADGELDPSRLPAFETHLLDCADCQKGFVGLVQLGTLGEEAATRAPARPRILFLRRRPSVPVMALAASLLLSVVTGATLWRMVPAGGGASDALWLGGSSSRMLEARVSQAEADRYRPYDVPRAGNTSVAPPPLTELGALERRGDQLAIAVAYLIRRQPQQASPYLDAAGGSAEADVNRAAASLLKDDPLDALERADRALRAAPGRPAALWNHALALRDMGLLESAAKDFDLVAAAGEPGWSGEARSRAEALRARLHARRDAWAAFQQACRELVAEGKPLSPEQVRAIPGQSRVCFYDAVRAAPSRDQVLALLPLAAQLDQLAGDAAASQYARRIAGQDLVRRKPLAEAYAQLATGGLGAAERTAFLDRLRAAGERDLLQGALLIRPSLPLPLYIGEYRKLATGSDDPWFQLLAEEKQGEAEVLSDRPDSAVERLQRAVERCAPGSRQGFRCAWLERTLAAAYAKDHQPTLAREHALKALGRAVEGGQWAMEQKVLIDLGQYAELDARLPLARAYLDEALLRSAKPCADEEELIRTSLALAYQRRFEFKEARRQLDLAAACPRPASLNRTFAVADVSRLIPGPDDERIIREGLEALRSSGAAGPGALALAKHVEGRFQVERDPALGQALLRAAIDAAAKQSPPDGDAQKARAYSYTSLLLDAGKRGEWPRALDLFAQELGSAPPASCVLGVTMDDERTLVVARGPGGELKGRFDGGRTAPLTSAAGLVPDDLLALLRPCATIEVIARPPLAGHADLLPADLPWSYRVSSGPPRRSEAKPRRLIVTGTVPPASLHLPALGTPALDAAGPSTSVLQGEAATPSRVLEAMRGATEIELHAHGLLDPERSDASFIALSPEAGGQFALSAADLGKARLNGAPVVLLAACYSARNASYLHENFGLPAAFLHAGARSVLAATQEIPDAEAPGFFRSVLERIQAGQPAPVALRDTRVQWKARGQGSWVEQVLLFE